jgi:DNA segregation ATPase FtsK/SpoIIIE, S-DNA-T family
MASSAARGRGSQTDSPRWPGRFRAAMRRAGGALAGVALVLLAAALALALVSYTSIDPSLNTVTARAPSNLIGVPGAWFADFALQMLGFAGVALVPVVGIAGLRLIFARGLAGWKRMTIATLAGAVALAAALGLVLDAPLQMVPAGAGGLAGLVAAHVALLLADVPWLAGVPVAGLAAALLVLVAAGLLVWGSGLERADGRALMGLFRRDGDEAPARVVAPRVRPQFGEDAADAVPAEFAAAPRAKIVEPRPAPASAKRAQRDRQPSLDLRDRYALPPLSLLTPAPKGPTAKIDAASLEQNARLLESVLEDFGVKGSIGEVRPGPVVTMYELEPAPGIKASRVIGLADDIARSMSALSARVAVVAGRNVIGIELPNTKREMVILSELLNTQAFEDQSAALPLVLGKNIAGDPVIADLSPMPHLLIAGTTGSGKSVGLNCMILSLLYRLSPEQCRMIMIDPKMLELSVYDGIPHLLSPVVTEPAKAIRALKWAVEQMEDRYRMMASINVRSLSGFNQRVRESKATGKPFERKVHTGYDAESGTPVYETEQLEFEPLPLIVVVVDELADLMMTAGKEVEFLIQRLAQKARAAGIHLIMATQRPSVDVITGVIKANLPTRISFAVTSKIDSRTILGEQGAEQLLGKGDMLYMPGGKQVVRVHGPFVSDEEVEAVADHWRTQGHPEYLDAVTAEPDGDDDGPGGSGLDFGGPRRGGDGGEEAELYSRAVRIVAESQKASTSYIQRQLRIGYNNAARLIEQMEKDGYVGVADHVGRREVLIDASGERM